VPSYEVITICPVHQKNVYIRVSASNVDDARRKVLGMTIHCPWGPLDGKSHTFVVGFRAGEKEILGVSTLPWMPSQTVSSAPEIAPVAVIPPTPLETFYYIDPDVAEKQLRKSDWWER